LNVREMAKPLWCTIFGVSAASVGWRRWWRSSSGCRRPMRRVSARRWSIWPAAPRGEVCLDDPPERCGVGDSLEPVGTEDQRRHGADPRTVRERQRGIVRCGVAALFERGPERRARQSGFPGKHLEHAGVPYIEAALKEAAEHGSNVF